MLRSLALTAALSLSALTAAAPPAAAEQIAVSITPTTAEEDALIRLGLALYMLHKDYETNGEVTQRGIDNAAGLYQQGNCNTGLIEQRGRNHTGTLSQRGCNNAHGMFQSGRNTAAHVVQTGGQAGLTFVYGF
ncbi:hypothetical protein OG2516_13439 [Oceanicola granulosus HTCC2516]|uniref:Uncharacterized protein n=1 Tax=Oceanicola granulosus (strain ATCC BAA-861 / DSM 15982 / KCTC 12143 / HTCC2516) TaxID=314256 RepID=Q2CGY0_OCEGH|nr:hypothetical protein [Oceanicola granulosus]EAR52031.1 hypothetical protein OG2516_13439 [Oceanicola granulosus HTCC2516]